MSVDALVVLVIGAAVFVALVVREIAKVRAGDIEAGGSQPQARVQPETQNRRTISLSNPSLFGICNMCRRGPVKMAEYSIKDGFRTSYIGLCPACAAPGYVEMCSHDNVAGACQICLGGYVVKEP